MRRHEAVALLTAAVGLIVAGAAWLFGPYGLLGSGVLLALVVLLVVDVKE